MPKPSIAEFTPTGVVSLDDLLVGVADTPPTETIVPKVEKVEPVVPQPKEEPSDNPVEINAFVPDNQHLQEEPKPNVPPKKDNSALREQTKKLAAEKAALEEQLQREKSEREAEKLAIEKARQEFEELKQNHEKLTVQVSQKNPMSHPDIRKITDPWNARVPQLAVQLRESGLKVNKLEEFLGQKVGEYLNAGDPNSDEFVERMDSIRDSVDVFTAGIRRESDKSSAQEKIMSMIRDGASVGQNVRQALSEMQANAPMFHYREQLAVYENEAREYEQVERDFFNPTEDLRMGDPLHQKVILRAMIDGSDEVKKAAQNAKLFSKMISLPVKPLNPQELEKVEPEKRNDAQLAYLGRHHEAKKRAIKLIPEALVAYAVLPALWKELEDLRKRVAGDRSAPKPGLHSQGTDQADETALDIKEFIPVGKNPLEIPL